ELRNHATLLESAVEGAVERGQMGALKQRLERLATADRILGVAAFDGRGVAILVTDHIAGATPELAAMARRASSRGEDLEEERELMGVPALVRTVTFARKTGPPVVATLVRDLGYLRRLSAVLNRGLVVTGVVLLALTGLVTAVASDATVGRPARALVEGVERL